MIDLEEVKLKFLANRPIWLDGAGYMYPTSIQQMIDIGINTYNALLSCLLIDKSAFKSDTQEEDFVNSDIFFFNCYRSEDFQQQVIKILQVLFRKECRFFTTEQDIGISIGENEGILGHTNFDDLQAILRIGNHIKDPVSEPEYKPGNSKAQEMINMIMKNKKKQPKPTPKMDLHSILSGLAWKSNGFNLNNIFDLNIYQVYNGLATTENIDNYNFTVSGIYAGTIDSKKVKMADLHWANKIKAR